LTNGPGEIPKIIIFQGLGGRTNNKEMGMAGGEKGKPIGVKAGGTHRQPRAEFKGHAENHQEKKKQFNSNGE